MMENPVWRDYVLRYNVLYHDYGYNDKELEILLGPEPPRYIEGSSHGFSDDEWERADEIYQRNQEQFVDDHNASNAPKSRSKGL